MFHSGAPPQVSIICDTLGMVFLCGSAFIVAFVAAGFVTKKPENKKKKDPIALADLYFSQIYYAVLGYLAVRATIDIAVFAPEFGFDPMTARWTLWTGRGMAYCILYVAGNLVHVPITWIKQQDLSFKIMMTVHHFMSIIATGSPLLSGKAVYFVTVMGICEISTWLLTQQFMLKELGCGKKGQLANSLMLILAYFFLRVVLFPMVLWQHTGDLYSGAMDENLRTSLGGIETHFLSVTAVILIVLSVVWFIILVKGGLKLCFQKDDKRE